MVVAAGVASDASPASDAGASGVEDEADGDADSFTFSSDFSSLAGEGASPGQRDRRVEGSLRTTVLDPLLDRPAMEDDAEAVVDSEEDIARVRKAKVRLV